MYMVTYKDMHNNLTHTQLNSKPLAMLLKARLEKSGQLVAANFINKP